GCGCGKLASDGQGGTPNVLDHGFEPGQAGAFDVGLLRPPGHVVVAVEDQGIPFHFAKLEAAGHARLVAPSLMGVAESIRYMNLGTRGNRVEIAKRLPFKAIDRYFATGTAAPVAAAPVMAPPGDGTI